MCWFMSLLSCPVNQMENLSSEQDSDSYLSQTVDCSVSICPSSLNRGLCLEAETKPFYSVCSNRR